MEVVKYLFGLAVCNWKRPLPVGHGRPDACTDRQFNYRFGVAAMQSMFASTEMPRSGRNDGSLLIFL
jgi:hypothetical protein